MHSLSSHISDPCNKWRFELRTATTLVLYIEEYLEKKYERLMTQGNMVHKRSMKVCLLINKLLGDSRFDT
jgi:hypothetical protein